MKIVISTLIFAAAAGAVFAQEQKTPVTPQPAVEAKMVIERAQAETKMVTAIAAGSDKIVKNSPFTADAVSESVQTLADGNRIVRNSTSKLYRNSEGRFRREIVSGSGGLAGSVYTYGSGITILDPVVGFRYTVDPDLKTVRSITLKPIEMKLKELQTTSPEAKIVALDKLKTELKVSAMPNVSIATTIPGQVYSGAYSTTVGSAIGGHGQGGHTKYESRTEKLGIQNFEGVDAEGTRTTTTIPAGAIGNERPIETVYESWYSNDLQLVVFSKTSDPRFGEQTYKLTNIIRSEPDPSLFSLPTGYKLINQSGQNKLAATRAEYEKAAAAKAAQAPATYVKNKP